MTGSINTLPLMQSSISVHDNFIYVYTVDCKNQRIVLHTAYLDNEPHEWTDLVFRDVVAHHFEHVQTDNIIFDMEEDDLASVVNANADLFRDSWRYGWPSVEYAGDLQVLISQLQATSVRAFVINSSFGMHGWVLAGNCERVTRTEQVTVG